MINNVYELLSKIDEGYVPTYIERQELTQVETVGMFGIRKLPKSIKLLKNLKLLVLSGNENLTDISDLAVLTSLRALNLSGCNRLSDISALSGLEELVFLDLSDTRVRDIGCLCGLTKLKYLDLSCSNPTIRKYSRDYEINSADSWNDFLFNQYFEEFYIKLCDEILPESDITKKRFLKGADEIQLAHCLGQYYSEKSYFYLLTTSDSFKYFFEDLDPRIRNINVLSNLINLTVLNLSGRDVTNINTVLELRALEILFLSNAQVDINAISELTALKFLDLSGTNVRDISGIFKMKSLEGLNLSHMTLTAIPEFILDLGLEFVINKPYKYNFNCIYIHGLKLTEQPIEIFSQERELVRAYYRSQDRVPINECKVIFLGDAEAGKTHSIKRLIKKGEYLTDFDGNSTPGIEITISSTKIEETDVAVNYWDFGGQEIQHSMHRMFLTERTVYVVFLNARQDPLDDRARYWIENIKSFASSAPILLVINKIDQNDRPKFNEDGIRAEYKDQIKDVVRMSALNDEPHLFMKELQGSINKIIQELPTASTMVPKAWKSLMENLRGTNEHYLTSDQFKLKCDACYVNEYDTIHHLLADLFQVIGVSFCYYKDRSTADYMLLNPKWLVNAVYTIVTNSKNISKNGIITQGDLYDVLKNDCIYGVPVKRVVSDWRYKGIEVNYILSVIRMFRLSYPLKDGSEFFPMLCDGNEKIAVSKIVSLNALHYIFQYTYLPPNVIHSLIVEKQRELNYNYVWYSGAVFSNKEQGQTAYVHSIGNNLHIYVDSKNSFYNPNEYLTPLINDIRNINKDMGLQAEELIGVQRGGNKEEIAVSLLLGNLQNGIMRIFVSEEIGVIDIQSTLFRYSDNRSGIDENLFNDIIVALEEMQKDPVFYSQDENSRNRFVAKQLRSAGHICGDQSPGGVSYTGKSIGARDNVIMGKDLQDKYIYEGLNLNSFNTSKINEHLEKTLVNYNPQGLPYGFMVTYLDCAREKYDHFIGRYKDHIKEYAPEAYRCVSNPIIVGIPDNGQYITCIKMDYECGEKYFTIYHIIIRLAA